MNEHNAEQSSGAFPSPTQPPASQDAAGRRRPAATRYAVTAVILVMLGTTALAVAVTGLDDDSRQRIAACDTGAAAAPAASWYLTALA
ncbi:MAG: hypothetical protein JXA67_14580, partial [Micromonosporaceae bacterium]|nr:hypothetical protein [Micromonosporaceae bacterium]